MPTVSINGTGRQQGDREPIPGAELREYDDGHAFIAQDPSAHPEIIEWLAG